MTSSKQPHPQRCETCRHYQTRFECGNKKICTLIKEKVPSSYQIGIPFYIDIVGCASHSSATEPDLLCDDCNILELEEKLMNLEQELKELRCPQ